MEEGVRGGFILGPPTLGGRALARDAERGDQASISRPSALASSVDS
ncbi:hypothetical protein RSAG8_06961, partial [Rhizoctonia solani AG-8 WAC10335]